MFVCPWFYNIEILNGFLASLYENIDKSLTSYRLYEGYSVTYLTDVDNVLLWHVVIKIFIPIHSLS